MVNHYKTIVMLLCASGGQDLPSITREVRTQSMPDIPAGEAGRLEVFTVLSRLQADGIATREWMDAEEDEDDGTGYHYWELTTAGYLLAASYS